MPKADGDPFIDGDILSYQEMNRILTAFYQASEPSNLQPGCSWVKSLDDKYYLMGGADIDEILQMTRSFDIEPRFAGLNIVVEDNQVICEDGEVVFYSP